MTKLLRNCIKDQINLTCASLEFILEQKTFENDLDGLLSSFNIISKEALNNISELIESRKDKKELNPLYSKIEKEFSSSSFLNNPYDCIILIENLKRIPFYK